MLIGLTVIHYLRMQSSHVGFKRLREVPRILHPWLGGYKIHEGLVGLPAFATGLVRGGETFVDVADGALGRSLVGQQAIERGYVSVRRYICKTEF